MPQAMPNARIGRTSVATNEKKPTAVVPAAMASGGPTMRQRLDDGVGRRALDARRR